MRFTRKQRLSTQEDFRFVFSRPKSSRDSYFKVLGRNNGKDVCRLGMAVSRKNCRKAVGRNRLKRLIRESFRHHGEQLAAGHGIDFVVLPTAEAVSICSDILAGSLDTHWQRIQSATRRSVDTNNRKELNG